MLMPMFMYGPDSFKKNLQDISPSRLLFLPNEKNKNEPAWSWAISLRFHLIINGRKINT